MQKQQKASHLMLGQSQFKEHFSSPLHTRRHAFTTHTHYRLMFLPAGKCLLSPEFCSYPWNGPLPTVSPLDSYKLQDVFASNWMSNFIATSISLPPAANDKQEHAFLPLDMRAWQSNSKATALSSVQEQTKQKKNSHGMQSMDAVWHNHNPGQTTLFSACLYQLHFP